jgi:hypothetical protein
MMSQTTVEIPAESYKLPVHAQSPVASGVSLTTVTMVAGYDKVKHLLSGKPLRRPNRRRPLR